MREPLNRRNLSAFGLYCQDQAAIHWLPIDEYGAGAAVAVVATFFGTAEVECVPEHLQQALPRLAQKLGRLAIDRGRHVNLLCHRIVPLRKFSVAAQARRSLNG
jgi:hypothetical protein